MTMTPEIICYSWQPDLNKDHNFYFIRDCGENALKAIRK
jgi:hypothetical protein